MQKINGFEKADLDKDIYIDEVKITYCQVSDNSGEDKDEVQTMTLSARNNGVQRYVNIKTESWSIDTPDELVSIVRDFEKRADMYHASESIVEIKKENDLRL